MPARSARPSTRVLKATPAAIRTAAALLKQGKPVAFPTETVYGLGANALSELAVRTIFAAKQRPADNPIIVHVADEAMLRPLVTAVSKRAQLLIDTFWPGPLTILFPASKKVPHAVTAGLPTVGVRMPKHPVALALLKAANIPIAAPSANRSGLPSPTTAAHVHADLDGRIPLILDGGPSSVGVESTVIDLSTRIPTVLRPGGVSLEALRAVLGPVQLASSKTKARAPGMKYRHYAPEARIVLVESPTLAALARTAEKYKGSRIKVLRPGELTLRNLYAVLRKADEKGYAILVVPAVPERGDGVALMNRLRKAATLIVKASAAKR